MKIIKGVAGGLGAAAGLFGLYKGHKAYKSAKSRNIIHPTYTSAFMNPNFMDAGDIFHSRLNATGKSVVKAHPLYV